MTDTELRDTVLRLPPQERLELVEVLWGSLDQESVPMTEWQMRLLDERIDSDDESPDSGSSWSEVKSRILKKL
jgi:putative addiction module component (TIGR02574 family)